MHSTENSGQRELMISGTGAPLVLLHGWSMNSAVWQPVQQQLETDWQIHRINLPGHGGCSYLKTKKSFDEWLANIMAVAPAKAVWLGWSLGGLFALAAAARFPQRVQRLILVASSPKFIVAKGWLAAGDLAVWQTFSNKLLDNPDATNNRFLRMQAIGSDKPMQLSKQLNKLQTEGGKADVEALLSGLKMLQEIDLRRELKNISCPVHWLLGDGDQLVPVDVAQDIKALMPDCNIYIIPSAGHAVFVSQPDRFMQIIKQL